MPDVALAPITQVFFPVCRDGHNHPRRRRLVVDLHQIGRGPRQATLAGIGECDVQNNVLVLFIDEEERTGRCLYAQSPQLMVHPHADLHQVATGTHQQHLRAYALGRSSPGVASCQLLRRITISTSPSKDARREPAMSRSPVSILIQVAHDGEKKAPRDPWVNQSCCCGGCRPWRQRLRGVESLASLDAPTIRPLHIPHQDGIDHCLLHRRFQSGIR